MSLATTARSLTQLSSPTVAARTPGPAQDSRVKYDLTMSASPSPPLDASEASSSTNAGTNAPLLVDDEVDGAHNDIMLSDSMSGDSKMEVDPSIVEALRSKDRLFVLRLGEQMDGLFAEYKTQMDVLPTTSYQRLLVHRCAAYYRLQVRPENDPASKGLIVIRALESRIPPRKLCDLVPAELPSQPAFKIMRRISRDRARSKAYSQAGSVAGDDADLSDVEPSESGSAGGRSYAGSKKRMTIEEREAAYNEARSRIFMGFEEKEKDKEKDMSGSSSTRSLVSGGGETSSTGDMDDSASTAATESEWSGPISRDKKEGKRGNNSTGSSNRSLRSSTRGSRATSPAFTYASLYEPPIATTSYDPSQMVGPPSGYMPPYMYGYPIPPGPAQSQGYLSPYPYFPPYSYQPPQPYQMTHSDPVSPAGGDMYPPQHHPPPPIAYPNGYMWPPQQPPPPAQPSPSQHPSHPSPPHTNLSSQPIQNAPQYAPQNAPVYPSPYAPMAHMYGSYISAYYPPQSAPPSQQPQQISSPSHIQNQPMYFPEMPPGTGLVNNGGMGGSSNGNGNGNHSRTSSRNSSNTNGNVNGGGRRGAPQARHAWTYGPGVGVGGYGGSGDVVGPRMSSSMRRTSGTSSAGSGSTGNRTPGDEASSTAQSSSTSSSSRRTYTSTSTTSKHPLPARPDWAVGLKPQSHPRHHEHNNNNSQSMSPVGNGVQPHTQISPQQQHHSHTVPPGALQSNDFPPLTSLSSPPRPPVTAGAWTNTSSTRSILMPSAGQPGQPSSYGSALVQYPNTNGNANSSPRLDSQDRAFERPPSKGHAELFNPKGSLRRPSNSSNNTGRTHPQVPEKERVDRERARGEAIASAILVDRVGAMTLDGREHAADSMPNGAMPVSVAAESSQAGVAVAVSTT